MAGRSKARRFLHDIDNEKTRSFQERAWELFGFGLQYTWLLSLVLTPILPGTDDSIVGVQPVRLLIIVGLALSYIVFYLFRQAIPTGRFNKRFIIAGGVCGCVMTLILMLTPQQLLSPVVIIIAALLAGFANSIAMLGGNRLWADHRAERAMMAMAPSAFGAAIICLLISFVPVTPRVIIIALCPLIGHFILTRSKGGKPHAGSYRQISLNNNFFVRMSLFLFCFGFVAAAILGLVVSAEAETMIRQSQWLLVAVIAATLIAFILAIRRSVSGFLKTINKLSVPVSLIGLALFYPLPVYAVWIAVGFVLAGYILIDLFMWLLCSDLVYRTRQNSFTILARTCALQWSGLALGFIIGSGGRGLPFSVVFVPEPVLIFVCAVILVLSSSFLFTQHDAVLFVEARTDNESDALRYEVLGRLAESHALSRRESEVFILVANGRSAPYIKDELSISESTVKTYIHNIYCKFEVENRQELLDAVERHLSS